MLPVDRRPVPLPIFSAPAAVPKGGKRGVRPGCCHLEWRGPESGLLAISPAHTFDVETIKKRSKRRPGLAWQARGGGPIWPS